MKVAVEAVEGCKRRLAVEAPADVVQQEWERAYGRVQKQARLPGFRKGHVPRSLVKLHFAADVRREVAEHLIPEIYRQALTDARLDPVNEPDLQDVRLAVEHRKGNLRGGAGSATVKVVEVKEKVLPVLDGEFAKSLGEFDTLGAVRDEVRKQLEARRSREERLALEDKMADVLLARH